MKAKVSHLQSGQELVEFALTASLLILLTFGIVDLGRAVYYYSLLFNSAREGSRYAAVLPQNMDGIRTAAERLAVGIDPASPEFTYEYRCRYDDGGVCPSGVSGAGIPDQSVRVTLTYAFTPATPIIGRFLPGGMVTLRASSTMQLEY